MDRIEDFEVNSPRWLFLEDFEDEIWKDIPDFEGCYMVSNMGRIKSLDRITNYKRTCDSAPATRFFEGKIIKASYYGQYQICHLKKGNIQKAVKYHRVVCSVFHPNPENLPEVNHINEIKTDNRACNLEWCTRKYNANWGTGIIRQSIANTNNPLISEVVYQFTLDGKFVEKFPSANEAERITKIKSTNILSVCDGTKSSSAGGYIWSHSMSPAEIQKKITRKEKGLKRYSKKQVCQYTIDGEFLKEYESISDAAKQTGADRNTITRCCKHSGRYHTAGGYKWEYKDTPDRDERAKLKVPIKPKRKFFNG